MANFYMTKPGMTQTTTSTVTRHLAIARYSCWISYIGLFITLACNGIYSHTHWFILLITLLPLLIFVPGMRKENHKTLAMLCFVCLIYFTAITLNLFKPEPGLLDILEMVWVSLLFISAMVFSRWIQRDRYERYEQALGQHSTKQPDNPGVNE